MLTRLKLILLLLSLALPNVHAAETPLFDAGGRAAAYITEDLTIYLWSGRPVAYLFPDNRRDDYHIYGFNGKHLGWLIKGIARNDQGDAACAIKAAPEFPPTKGIKESRPIKAIRDIPPLRPMFSLGWSEQSCGRFLLHGAD